MQPASSCRLCRSLSAIGRRVLSIESFGAFQGKRYHLHVYAYTCIHAYIYIHMCAQGRIYISTTTHRSKHAVCYYKNMHLYSYLHVHIHHINTTFTVTHLFKSSTYVSHANTLTCLCHCIYKCTNACWYYTLQCKCVHWSTHSHSCAHHIHVHMYNLGTHWHFQTRA